MTALKNVTSHMYAATTTSLLILLFVVSCPIVVVNGASSDPRCNGYTCRFTQDVYERTSVDPTTCWDGCMDKCLVGDEWDTRRTELGTGLATRTFVPSIIFDDWLSAEISESIYRILLEEMLGYTVEGVTGPTGGFDILCCDRNLVIMERWPQDEIPDDEGYFSLSEVSTGYEGGSGLYVTQATVDQYPLSTAYNAYKYLPNYTNIYPAAFSTPCENTTVDPSLGCVDGNYVCNTNDWTNTTCTQGYYVPPVCEADPSSCQELYHVEPNYESGFFEGLIKNTDLKFVIAYVGLENLRSIVIDRSSKGLHSMFYAWEPDSLVNLLNATPVTFKTPSSECSSKENIDPTLNLADCDYQKTILTKLALTSKLLKDTDYKFFFESFSLTSTTMKSLIKQHPQGGGALPVYNISCQWLQQNYGTWKDWIRNTPTTTITDDSSSASTLAIIVAVVVSVVGLALVLGVIYFFMMYRAKQAVKFAPKKVPFALMFTDVECSTMLWERYGSDMEEAMDIHHSTIRELISDYQCYEVKTIGDSFMIACPTLVDCSMLALAIQTRLFEATWPRSLRDWKDTPMGEGDHVQDSSVWCGLRVRIGVHHCKEVEPKFDVIHKRYDYYGHDVNMTARVESMGQGGQILMTEDTHHVLTNDPDFNVMIGTDATIYHFASGVTFKGVSDLMTVYSMVPTPLAKRHFEPLAGCVLPDAATNLSKQSSSKASNDDCSVAGFSVLGTPKNQGHDPSSKHAAVRKVAELIFGCCSTNEERDALLKKCCQSRDIKVSERGAFHRRLRIFVKSMEDEHIAHQLSLNQSRNDYARRHSGNHSSATFVKSPGEDSLVGALQSQRRLSNSEGGGQLQRRVSDKGLLISPRPIGTVTVDDQSGGAWESF